MFNPQIAAIPVEVCWQEYQRVVPFLKDTLMENPKHVNVGTIGQVDHGRSNVSACVSGALGTLPKQDYNWTPLVPVQQPLNAMNATMLDVLEDALLNGRDVVIARHLAVE
ncbi:hypothetical protein BIZ78_gp078 [Erwinia phage vB_EamM_Caitlin]|uniref:hypothetical protein n=1 Tax=Erwinia phage vB_EamM_Caitlin TaxID=1883379 RepID=UPI00081C637E|nr:hypothetical protein BIZ78_gp078 [Erwinia phage vB_EamM_Caitlin]ANZ48497.1 hypothetical protein CAITLIN_202 [Erwinia phage vB_EamM_Caitlin]